MTRSTPTRFAALLSLASLAVMALPVTYAASRLEQDEPRSIWGPGSGPSAPCSFTISTQASIQEARVFEAARSGLLHTPTTEKRIGVGCINIPHDLALDRLILEWDVTPGEWSAKYAAGSHNLGYVHRGSYNSNTIGNVNLFGKGKNFIGMNQNLDLKTGKVSTGRLRNVELVMGGRATYHLRYTYDAASRKALFAISGPGINGATEFEATAKDQILQIPKKNRWSDSSLFVEFGHYGEFRPSAGKPAVPTYGWKYSNLRLKLYSR